MTGPQELIRYLASLHADLEAVGVEYAVVGALALAPHNAPRETSDIDILVSSRSADRLRDLHGQGYLLRPGATHNLWMFTGGPKVPVDVLIEGQEYGLPDPTLHRIKLFGVWFIKLDMLIEMKRKSGRPQDMVDVENLMKNA